MKKIRTYAALVSIVASVSVLSACSDNEPDELADVDTGVESPATQVPPVTTPEPSPAETPPATTPEPASNATGSDTATDITPEPGS